jgi:hypothetical protein
MVVISTQAASDTAPLSSLIDYGGQEPRPHRRRGGALAMSLSVASRHEMAEPWEPMLEVV